MSTGVEATMLDQLMWFSVIKNNYKYIILQPYLPHLTLADFTLDNIRIYINNETVMNSEMVVCINLDSLVLHYMTLNIIELIMN